MYGEPRILDEYDLGEIWHYAPEEVKLLSTTPELIHSYAVSTEGYAQLDCAGVYQTDLHTYYSFSGWCDTTGWDCQSGVNWYGPFKSVMSAVNALTQEERRYLGFEHNPVPEDIYRDYGA